MVRSRASNAATSSLRTSMVMSLTRPRYRSRRCCRLPRGGHSQKGTSARLVRQPDDSRQRSARSEAAVEGAGGANAPPAGPSGVCAASAARPGASRDSVQAVVLPGRHRRPVTSPMTQLDGPVECPSLSPWRTYHDEPSCLTARPVEPHPRTTVKVLARLLVSRPTLLIRGARDRHARAPRAAGSRRVWSGSRLLRDRNRREYWPRHPVPSTRGLSAPPSLAWNAAP